MTLPINPKQDTSTLLSTLKFYLNPNDGRFEDLAKGNLVRNITKDLTAGLVVAMVAIPLAMGFAMASGLRPEQGMPWRACWARCLAAVNIKCMAQLRRISRLSRA